VRRQGTVCDSGIVQALQATLHAGSFEAGGSRQSLRACSTRGAWACAEAWAARRNAARGAEQMPVPGLPRHAFQWPKRCTSSLRAPQQHPFRLSSAIFYGTHALGTLPPQWGNMINMKRLQLSANQLSGTPVGRLAPCKLLSVYALQLMMLLV